MDQREAAAMRLQSSSSSSYYMHHGPAETEPVITALRNSPSPSPFSSTGAGGNLSHVLMTSLHVDNNPSSSTTMSGHGGVSHVGPTPNVLLQGELPVRRKRGRPRKYGPGAASVSLALSPNPMSGVGVPTAMRQNPKRRGRPLGSGRKTPQVSSSNLGSINLSSGSLLSGGGTMTPHIINVGAGEDIRIKILSFVRGRGAVVILSGVGSISAANIRISGSGGSVTYEGHFDILTLSGSYVNDVDSPHDPTGGLNVTLCGPDGRVIGGQVEAVLIAASVVQVIVGSLLPRTSKSKLKASEDPQPSSNMGNLSTSANIQSNPLIGTWQSTQ